MFEMKVIEQNIKMSLKGNKFMYVYCVYLHICDLCTITTIPYYNLVSVDYFFDNDFN